MNQSMPIRDRVRELRRVRAADLRPHPQNWRRHPQTQRDALRGALAEIGYAGALLARELEDGALQLIDGHLRAETTPEAEVPVLVLDVDEAEAAKLLAINDPLAAMAEADEATLGTLLADVETENAALRALLDGLPCGGASEVEAIAEPEDGPPRAAPVPEAYQVVVECDGEAQQQAVYERLTAEGLRCRVLTL